MINKNELLAEIKKRGWTQQDFAKELGVSLTCLNLKINGKFSFKTSEIEKMKEILGRTAVKRIFF